VGLLCACAEDEQVEAEVAAISQTHAKVPYPAKEVSGAVRLWGGRASSGADARRLSRRSLAFFTCLREEGW